MCKQISNKFAFGFIVHVCTNFVMLVSTGKFGLALLQVCSCASESSAPLVHKHRCFVREPCTCKDTQICQSSVVDYVRLPDAHPKCCLQSVAYVSPASCYSSTQGSTVPRLGCFTAQVSLHITWAATATTASQEHNHQSAARSLKWSFWFLNFLMYPHLLTAPRPSGSQTRAA